MQARDIWLCVGDSPFLLYYHHINTFKFIFDPVCVFMYILLTYFHVCIPVW